MIKYASIKEFKALGEAYIGAHLYQWMREPMYESTNPTEKYGAVVLVRAYDIEPRVWVGYIFNGNDTYINGAQMQDGALDELVKILGPVKQCDDLKEFIDGHGVEYQFENFQKTTWEERINLDSLEETEGNSESKTYN